MDAEGSRRKARRKTPPSGPPPAGEEARGGRLPGPEAGGLSGRRLGQYEILEEVGRGGMGVVYKARDRTLDRTVAVKVLPGHLASDPDFTKRFIREARAAARLDHPGIVQVYQAGKTTGVLFIAMQYVEARSLSKIIDEEGPQGGPFALSVTRQAADALALAHEQGIVHRDIKPSNIMVDEKGRVKVMDFGLAKEIDARGKITRTGTYIGTPEYSSPEQCETREIDGRSDIYSLGIVLYEMLSGRVPFEAETPLKLFEKICYEEPEPITTSAPNVGRGLARLVERMMAKDREDRYADCAELVADVERVEGGESPKVRTRKRPRPVRRRGPVGRDRRTSGRRGRPVPPVAWAAAAALVVLALGAYLVSTRGRGAKDAPSPAAEPAGASAETPPAPRESSRRTVMVRDFANSTGKSGLDWLRVGIADMLITDLAACDFLDVMSRERARAAASVRTPGRAADIELKGSFAEAGGRIMVVAQLVDAEGGTVLRAVRAEGTEAGIFRIIDEVSSQVRAGLEKLLAERLGGPVRLTRTEGGVASRLFLAMADRGERGRTIGTGGEADKARHPAERVFGAAGRGGGRGTVAKKRALRGAPPGAVRAKPGSAVAKPGAVRQADRELAIAAGPPPPAPAADRPAAVEAKAALQAGAPVKKAKVPSEAAEAEKRVALARPTPAKAAATDARRRAPHAPESVRALARKGAADGKARSIGSDRRPDATLRSSSLRSTSDAAGNAVKAEAASLAGPAGEDLEELKELKKQVRAGDRLAERASAPKAKVDARPPRVAAIRARYRAMAVLEAGSDRGSLEKALSLLEEARSLAPGLVGIGDEIARVRALIEQDKTE